MLLSKLASFTHSVDSFRIEGWKSDYDSLRLYRAESLEIYVADSHVPQLDACLRFETFAIHGLFHLVRVEDEYATISPSLGYESAIFLDEATFSVEGSLCNWVNPASVSRKSTLGATSCGVMRRSLRTTRVRSWRCLRSLQSRRPS